MVSNLGRGYLKAHTYFHGNGSTKTSILPSGAVLPVDGGGGMDTDTSGKNSLVLLLILRQHRHKGICLIKQ